MKKTNYLFLPMKLTLETEVLEVTGENVNSEEILEKIRNKIEILSVEQLEKLSFISRENYEHRRMLYDTLLKKVGSFHMSQYDNSSIEKKYVSVNIEVLGLVIYHNIDPKIYFDDLSDIKDRRIDFLKGIYKLKCRVFEDATFLFNKVGYKRGIDICNVSRGSQNILTSSDCKMLWII